MRFKTFDMKIINYRSGKLIKPLIILQSHDLQGCAIPQYKDLINICLEIEFLCHGMTCNVIGCTVHMKSLVGNLGVAPGSSLLGVA